MTQPQVDVDRPARRGPRARSEILQATTDLLLEHGYPALSVEAIARRAGISKVTIYRWWPHKAAVAMDAFLAFNAPQVGYPDTGSTREDFRRQMALVRDFFLGPGGPVVRALIAEIQHDPQLAEDFRMRFWEGRRKEGRAVLQRGIDRGELRGDLDPTAVLDVLYAPLYIRLLVGHADIDTGFLAQLIDCVFDGLNTPSTR